MFYSSHHHPLSFQYCIKLSWSIPRGQYYCSQSFTCHKLIHTNISSHILCQGTRYFLSDLLYGYGTNPTRSFFIKQPRLFFKNDVSGAGGATTLAKMGSPPSLIQAIGCWTSESFRIYVRKNPVLIQAMGFARRREPTLCRLAVLNFTSCQLENPRISCIIISLVLLTSFPHLFKVIFGLQRPRWKRCWTCGKTFHFKYFWDVLCLTTGILL